MSVQNETAPLPQTATPRFLRRLVVATDGSENGRRAVSFAVALALRLGSEVELCCAIDRTAAIAECCSADGSSATILPLIASLEETARTILAEASDSALVAGLKATTCVLDGSAPEAIVAHQRACGADAIVIGTKGSRGVARLLMGSTADGVLRRAEVPVIVVPQQLGAARAHFDRFLVAIDDSDPSDAATAFAIAFANAEKARLLFCGVVETDYFATDGALLVFDAAPMIRELRESIESLVTRAADRARDSDVAAEWLVVDGDAEAQIPKIADSERAGAIVIGTHGRRGVRRWIMGSVAEGVVQNSSVPIVVVRGATR